MIVVGLISGGKDSLHSLALAVIKHGHKLAGVANLRPAAARDKPESDELDSYMYQTVGFNMVPAIADCLGVPLIVQEISGTSISLEMQYDKTEGDEVEDLYCLLAKVKERWPEVEGIVTGAVLSTYQRTRVEDVCIRLGLKSIAYLWQRDQADLISEMISSDLHAIVVKVASMGLGVKHLGKSIAALAPYFEKLNGQFGFHQAGEGGEYETLSLDSKLFWKSRIVLDKTQIVMHDDVCFSPVAYLKVIDYHLEQKEAIETPDWIYREGADAADAAAVLVQAQRKTNDGETIKVGDQACASVINSALPAQRRECGVHLQTSACFAPDAAVAVLGTVQEEVQTVFRQLQKQLDAHGSTLADVCFVNLYLRDMSTFALVNGAYCKYFGRNPPSRACVEVPLQRMRVMLDAYVVRSSGESASCKGALEAKSEQAGVIREVLHVKSLSEWAPLCIGPYAQMNRVGDLCHVAGQIGLVPETMQVLSHPKECSSKAMAKREADLCLQHCERVLACSGSSIDRVGVAVAFVASRCSESIDSGILGSLCDRPHAIVAVPQLPKDVCVEILVTGMRNDMSEIQSSNGLHCVDDDFCVAYDAAFVPKKVLLATLRCDVSIGANLSDIASKLYRSASILCREAQVKALSLRVYYIASVQVNVPFTLAHANDVAFTFIPVERIHSSRGDDCVCAVLQALEAADHC